MLAKLCEISWARNWGKLNSVFGKPCVHEYNLPEIFLVRYYVQGSRPSSAVPGAYWMRFPSKLCEVFVSHHASKHLAQFSFKQMLYFFLSAKLRAKIAGRGMGVNLIKFSQSRASMNTICLNFCL